MSFKSDRFFPVPTAESTQRHPEFDRFVQVIADLRAPNGCPWDLQQTHQSISKNMLEEAFEAVAAIEENDVDHMREELGDVLMQVVLQSQIAQDLGEFTIEDVAHDVSEKLIRRHPHVYGPKASFAALGVDPEEVFAKGPSSYASLVSSRDISRGGSSLQGDSSPDSSQGVSPDSSQGVSPQDSSQDIFPQDPLLQSSSSQGASSYGVSFQSASPRGLSRSMNADEVGDLWDVIKGIERQRKEEMRVAKRIAAGLDPNAPRGLMEDVSKAQPALLEAHDISRKAVSQGFEWASVDDVWAKVDEEIAEFKAAPSGSAEAEMEFGDILFSLVNVARKERLNAETCLRRACAKFRKRWEAMEAAAYEQGKGIDDFSVDELQALWRDAKQVAK